MRQRLVHAVAALSITAGMFVPITAVTVAVAPSSAGAATISPGNIDTVAGDGTAGYSGDQGSATSAEISATTTGVAVDGQGNIYLADTGNNRVRFVAATDCSKSCAWGLSSTTKGDIYTIAGNGTAGFSGDNGAAVSAELQGPTSLALDSSGDLFVADAGNHRVREIPSVTHPEGVSSTILTANDIYTVAGDGDASGSGGNGGAATSADLPDPQGIALDPQGNLFIADTGNNRVEMVAAAACSSNCPFGLSSTTAQDIYLVAGTGTVGNSGDDGAATAATLHSPSSVAFDAEGNLYVADQQNNRVREVARASEVDWGIHMAADDIYNVLGAVDASSAVTADGAPAMDFGLSGPTGIALDATGNLFVSDTGEHRIVEVAAKDETEWGLALRPGLAYTVAGQTGSAGYSGDGGPATSSHLHSPAGIATDQGGDMFLVDQGNDRVREMAENRAGATVAYDLTTVAGTGSAGTGSALQPTDDPVNAPADAIADSAGDVFVADTGSNRVIEIPGASRKLWGGSSVEDAGDLYVIAGKNNTPGSCANGSAATGACLSAPKALALDNLGDLFIADSTDNAVYELAAVSHTQWGIAMTAGDIYTVAGGGSTAATSWPVAATSAVLSSPDGVTLDAAGDLYVAESGQNRVDEVAAASGTQWGGTSMTANDIYDLIGSSAGLPGVTGDGGAGSSAFLHTPGRLATDASGNLFVADTDNNRVQFLAATSCSSACAWDLSSTSTGDMYTIAGSSTGVAGRSTSGTAMNSSSLTGPASVALSESGDLFVSDSGNNRILDIPAASGARGYLTRWSIFMPLTCPFAS